MNGSDDDFLWEAALSSPPDKDRRWLIPDKDDLRPPDDDECLAKLLGRVEFSFDASEQHIVRVLEQRERGAWDAVGGEVWEASLLISCWLRSHVYELIDAPGSAVLELGCGVALPSILLSQEMRSPFDIVVSDHDVCLLENIRRNLSSYSSIGPLSPHNVHSSHLQSSKLLTKSIDIAKLDWTVFGGSCSNEEFDLLLPPELQRDRFDILFGSALCYAPYHAVLGRLIAYYLSGRAKEVIVLQITDREGFHDLQSHLTRLQVSFTLEPVDEETYSQACRVHAQRLCKEGTDMGAEVYSFYTFPSEDKDCENRTPTPAIRTPRSAFGLLRASKS